LAIKKKKAHIRRKERQEQKEREKIVPSLLCINMKAADLSQVNSKQIDRIYNHGTSIELGLY
jgi:hypothetical protein